VRELRRRLELRIAELERRLDQGSSDSGTPSSKEPIGAKERRRAERRTRNASERERRNDRKPGGQPGHPGRGCPATLTLISRRAPGRRRNARGTGRAWPARSTRARRGLR
jgi:hypothetical protein